MSDKPTSKPKSTPVPYEWPLNLPGVNQVVEVHYPDRGKIKTTVRSIVMDEERIIQIVLDWPWGDKITLYTDHRDTYAAFLCCRLNKHSSAEERMIPLFIV